MNEPVVIGERAITLREAAALLRVSYNTVYARREELGFFQIGSIWRIWPDDLKAALRQDYNTRRQARAEKEKEPCLSVSAEMSIGLTSERQAASAFAARVARRTAKQRRNTTTS
ncbi:helix-turn-helix domain-containing protein [Paraburkholderia caribensis]|uniref:helix-turn-helix domain-containing protein n=1 Tax=Paraburkholderia caribensis TaxID=75105 RepID=UPI001F221D46|nr:helix-turn-helix domain-containing protein [Paraburkholderia caribensis]